MYFNNVSIMSHKLRWVWPRRTAPLQHHCCVFCIWIGGTCIGRRALDPAAQMKRTLQAAAPALAKTIAEMRLHRRQWLKAMPTASVGFVPTMGFLHEGHLSLYKRARKENDYVVASIFVNPSQFAAHEDLDVYPTNIERDLTFLEREGVDVVFLPSVDAMYGEHQSTWVIPESDGAFAEGKSRPGHFRGVATVVAKLFNIVQPTTGYFGQKDAQQAAVIKAMVEDLNIPVDVSICPTVREIDGLAMSSRNTNLSPEARKAAPVIYAGLKLAQETFYSLVQDRGARIPSLDIREVVYSLLDNTAEVEEVLYVSIANKRNLEELDFINADDGAIISVAVMMGGVRLIDNAFL